MLLHEYLPVYDFNEVHSVVISASRGEVSDAIKRVAPAEMPMVSTLFAIRALPARLLGRSGVRIREGQPILEQALAGGFVLLAEVPGQELVVGTIGQFWSLRGGPAPVIASPADFATFNLPGYAKAAMNFYLEPVGGGIRLRTETRILALDGDSRRKFARYWRIIYPGSAIIRRMWLRAIKHRAERG